MPEKQDNTSCLIFRVSNRISWMLPGSILESDNHNSIQVKCTKPDIYISTHPFVEQQGKYIGCKWLAPKLYDQIKDWFSILLSVHKMISKHVVEANWASIITFWKNCIFIAKYNICFNKSIAGKLSLHSKMKFDAKPIRMKTRHLWKVSHSPHHDKVLFLFVPR